MNDTKLLLTKYMAREPFADKIFPLVADVNDCMISVPKSISSIIRNLYTDYHVLKEMPKLRKRIDKWFMDVRLADLQDYNI